MFCFDFIRFLLVAKVERKWGGFNGEGEFVSLSVMTHILSKNSQKNLNLNPDLDCP